MKRGKNKVGTLWKTLGEMNTIVRKGKRDEDNSQYERLTGAEVGEVNCQCQAETPVTRGTILRCRHIQGSYPGQWSDCTHRGAWWRHEAENEGKGMCTG